MIHVKALEKEFLSGRGRVKALDGVSFRLEAGTVLAVAGISGSGKSTLLHCVGGLERPDSGEVICFGENLVRLGVTDLCRFQRRNLGFVFQSSNLLAYLTVFENIAFPLALNGVGVRERNARVRELLAQVGMAGADAARPHELSGGEQQRVAVARALAHEPRLILADEPTASLDSKTGMEVVKLLVGLGREGGSTLIISTHDPALLALADRHLRLSDGRVVES